MIDGLLWSSRSLLTIILAAATQTGNQESADRYALFAVEVGGFDSERRRLAAARLQH
jgi:hypothetical protein